jgi:AcrR family transcriptional regulator
MKVSESTKEKTKRKILEAAVTLMTEHGFQKVTMKQIAQKAEIGSATIYKYFASKERLLVGFYEMISHDTAKEVYETLEGSQEVSEDETTDSSYSLQESVQIILDTFIEKLMAEREFVQHSFKKLFLNPLAFTHNFSGVKDPLKSLFNDILQKAIDHGEIHELPFQSSLPNLMVDYTMGVVHYWLQDESEEFHETTQMIDLTLNLGITFLTSGIVNKTTELAGFLIKTQMFKIMNPGNPMLEQFMGGAQHWWRSKKSSGMWGNMWKGMKSKECDNTTNCWDRKSSSCW